MSQKVLVVIDMQNDFISGSLGTSEAQAIVKKVKTKINQAVKNKDAVLFTRDTHGADYLDTQEGKNCQYRIVSVIHLDGRSKNHYRYQMPGFLIKILLVVWIWYIICYVPTVQK